jgi:DNA mismatch repair protein MutS2
MHPGTLRALEFDRIVEVVRGLAVTPLGEARLAELEPATDAAAVEAALALTSEAARFLVDHPGLPLRAPADLDATLDSLAVEGRALDAAALAALAAFLESVEQCASTVRRAAHGNFPRLSAIAASVVSFEHEVADVRRAIDPAGEVFDSASPELRSIRDRLRKQRARLRGTLESYLRGKDTSKYLQDQVITDRNGRYVLLVRAEHRTSIPGIVHGSSASGASLFLEPLSTVEINNDIVALLEQEIAEVHRILLALTNAFRHRDEDLALTLSAATEFDVAQACGRFSRLIDGTAPLLSTDGRLELRAARHPMLIPAVDARLAQEEGEEPRRPPRTTGPVPVDIVLQPPTSILVITGPNTGGKTVALKTTGLLALMAQAGLHVPAAAGSRLPVFRSVFADIGDEQSIAANLSTFSWHVTNIASMDRAMELPALVLLDEIGAGTDPVEGGALGMAVLERFRVRGAIVVATTHYDTLKTYASTTTGVTGAAFGFTPEFEPTFRLVYGSPGRSLGLEMAGRLGLAPEIIDSARRFRSVREAQLAEHIAKVDHELHALEHERRLAQRERDQLAEREARFRAREDALREREEQVKRRTDAKFDDRLRDARREIDAVMENLKRRADALAAQAAQRVAQPSGSPLSTGETGAMRADARTALDRVVEKWRGELSEEAAPSPLAPPASGVGPPATPPSRGDRVAVGPLGLEGVVQAVHGREAEIDIRGKRLRAALDELRVLAPAGEARARVSVQVQIQARESASDLNVIGCTVDEALARTDKFLDEALVGELRTVRVIHGHGTGQLRRALGEFLQAHPMVARIGAAPPEQGGSGVTVVDLKE